MGEEAEVLNDKPNDTVESEESEVNSEESEETVQEEVEVVLEGAGSQPDKQHGIRKRINKLNAKRVNAEASQAETQSQLDHEREKSRVLQLALEQKSTEPLIPPDPGEFTDGVRDPQYAAELRKFNQPAIEAEVQKQTTNLVSPQAASTNPGLERRQQKHYERAAELKAKNFDEIEDRAIGILGNDIANHLIQNSDKSHLLLYYLGTNPDQAEVIKSLIETDPIKGVLQIGRLEAQLSVKPRANSEPAPDPDDELRGGTPSAGQANKYQTRLDKAREAAGESRNMSAVLAIKREAKAAGATVI